MVLAISAIEKLRDNTSIIARTGPSHWWVCTTGLRQAEHRGGSVSSNPMIAQADRLLPWEKVQNQQNKCLKGVRN